MTSGNASTPGSPAARRHFHTFDALRFFAFLKVFLLHVPIIAFPWFNYVRAGGGIGVQFFFVLSGFLITYIICEEKARTGQLNLKNFFVRRILRIWPLYYLMVAVAYITPYILEHFLHLPSSGEGYRPNIWVSVLFLENYKMMATGQHANVSPLSVMWTLCIEEHFYIVWGLLLYYLNLKDLPKLIVACLLAGLVCRMVYVANNIPTSDLFTNIDLFAYGAIPAYLLIAKGEQVDVAINKIPYWAKLMFIVSLLLTILVCSQYKTDKDYVAITSLLGLLFSLLIMLILPENNRLKIGDKNVLSRAGVYTYGLYLYHTLVINLLKQVYSKQNISLDNAASAIAFFVLALTATLLCSVLSYYLFEKPFLRLKKYFR
ncbi:acyltransferase family protein [Polluticoccus soli]|uniref:acyltransferase family protein n=1 Tax=Polluticoccus soli TaxID=3034150 RepID=UPI0023E1D1D8|nr:acyltransferase [Flavipsychrobacter sp. JY13-12]